MKKIGLVVILALATLAIAAAPWQRQNYTMLNCPAGHLGTDSNGNPNCNAPPLNLCQLGTCTGSAPTSSTDGMDLTDLSAFRVTICGPSFYTYTDGGLVHATYADGGNYVDGGLQPAAETLLDAGSLYFYVYNDVENKWTIDPGLTQGVTTTAQCQTFPDFAVGGSFQRLKVVPNGITMSLADGGATDAGMDILIDGQVNPSHWGY